MSRLRFVIASLLLSSAVGCAAATAGTGAPMQPVALQPAKPAIDRAALRAKLAERRAITMSHFLAYRENRVYPINTYGGTRHVWQDVNGNLCAAATLISYDWGRASTENVGKENREIALAKVTSGPLADWILTSGLTHHEIVAIQVPGSDEMGGGRMPIIRPDPENQRLFGIYIDVERQLTGLHDESLDEATDALMKRPELARELLAGHVASAGKYTAKTSVATK
jgi:hypothetical protein